MSTGYKTCRNSQAVFILRRCRWTSNGDTNQNQWFNIKIKDIASGKINNDLNGDNNHIEVQASNIIYLVDIPLYQSIISPVVKHLNAGISLDPESTYFGCQSFFSLDVYKHPDNFALKMDSHCNLESAFVFRNRVLRNAPENPLYMHSDGIRSIVHAPPSDINDPAYVLVETSSPESYEIPKSSIRKRNENLGEYFERVCESFKPLYLKKRYNEAVLKLIEVQREMNVRKKALGEDKVNQSVLKSLADQETELKEQVAKLKSKVTKAK